MGNNVPQKQKMAAEKERQLGQKLKGEKSLTVGDKTYEVFFSVNAMINLQKEYGSLGKVFEEFEKGQDMDFEVFLTFLHEGVKSRNKEVDKETLGDEIDFFDFGDIAKEVFGGALDAMPSNEEEEGSGE